MLEEAIAKAEASVDEKVEAKFNELVENLKSMLPEAPTDQQDYHHYVQIPGLPGYFEIVIGVNSEGKYITTLCPAPM